jgi:V-type H+-transporting ATPase subunit E
MSDEASTQVLKSMIAFIRSHGEERVAAITKQAEDEFTIQKEKYIAEEKERLTQDYKNKLSQDEIKLRIQKSAEQNVVRIKKMQTVNTLVEKLYKEAKHKMVEKQKNDRGAYQELIKNLLIQVHHTLFTNSCRVLSNSWNLR